MPGDSIVATLYYRETRYQMTIMLILSLVIGAVEYWYYFARYINSDLNNPDRFFFNYIPVIMYVLSLIFIGGRYTSMKALYQTIQSQHDSHRNRTVVRFLIFCADELLLHLGANESWDTPAEVTIGRTASLGMPKAELLFNEVSGHPAPSMRYCFTNDGFATGSNMIHYAVFIDPEQKDLFTHDDVWFNSYMLDNALSTKLALAHPRQRAFPHPHHHHGLEDIRPRWPAPLSYTPLQTYIQATRPARLDSRLRRRDVVRRGSQQRRQAFLQAAQFLEPHHRCIQP